LDLSKTTDLTALVLIFPTGDAFRQLAWFWLPEETVEKNRHAIDYRPWIHSGLQTIPGAVIDYRYIEERLLDVAHRFDLRGLHYDPYRAASLMQRMEDVHGMEVLEFKQTLLNFAAPTNEYERLLLDGKLRHNGNALLSWQAGHVQVYSDMNHNLRPVKPKKGSVQTIDGIVAGIMAVALATAEDSGVSRFDDPDEELMVI
jgi:phage terminase large subunit-like protein